MAVWAGLGQAATVAQLVGVDTGGLISMIMQAAVTARENKKECEQLARRVSVIADMLPHLQDPEVMWRPLAGLDDALREAHGLVMSCQGRSAAYRFVMAGRQADRFTAVQIRIDSYLIVFPWASHIAMTRRLDRICDVVFPNDVTSASSQGSQYSQQLDLAEVVQVAKHGAEVFTLAGIATVTNIFDLIGGSGSGFVYKGRLPDGREVVIKRLMNRRQKEKEAFCTELATISSLCHKNIVRLFGWCVEKEERLLVYEYMKNGTLDGHLHGQASSSPVMASWKMRIEVLLSVARAIEYLHCYARPAIIHGDIKSSNILFDTNWVPRVSDLGASVTWHKRNQRVECLDTSTIELLDPELHVMPTSDVYSFGVVMLEVLTGKKAIFGMKREQTPISLVDFALPFIEAGELGKVLDRRQVPEPTPWELKAVEVVARTAARCLRRQGKDHPAISDVVVNLEMALGINFEMALLVIRVGKNNVLLESAGAGVAQEEARVPHGAEELTSATPTNNFALDTTLYAGGAATACEAGLVAMKRIKKGLRDAKKVFRSVLCRQRHTLNLVGWCLSVSIIALFLAFALPHHS